MFGDVVLGIDHDEFEHELSAIKKAAGAKFDIELTAAHLKELVGKYKAVYVKCNKVLPDDPWEQLRMGVDAVFRWVRCLAGHFSSDISQGGAAVLVGY
jgi:pyruvate,orthophosphate dikinase